MVNNNRYISKELISYKLFAQSVDRKLILLNAKIVHRGKLAERFVSSQLIGAKISLCDKIKDFFGRLFSDQYCQAKVIVAHNLREFTKRYKKANQLNLTKKDRLIQKILGDRCKAAKERGEVLDNRSVQLFKNDIYEDLQKIPKDLLAKLAKDVITHKKNKEIQEYDIHQNPHYHAQIDKEGFGMIRMERKKVKRELKNKTKEKAIERHLLKLKKIEIKEKNARKALLKADKIKQLADEKLKNEEAEKTKANLDLAEKRVEAVKSLVVKTNMKKIEEKPQGFFQNLFWGKKINQKEQLKASMLEIMRKIEANDLEIKNKEALSLKLIDKEKLKINEEIQNAQNAQKQLKEELEIKKMEIAKLKS